MTETKTITGTDARDSLLLEGESYIVYLGGGDDFIKINTDKGIIDGGDGNDHVHIEFSTHSDVTLGAGADVIRISIDPKMTAASTRIRDFKPDEGDVLQISIVTGKFYENGQVVSPSITDVINLLDKQVITIDGHDASSLGQLEVPIANRRSPNTIEFGVRK